MYAKKLAAMPKIIAPLTIKQVNSITKEGFTALGGTPGLYLQVRGASRSWVYRYTSPETGKVTMTSLGPCSSMSLLAARTVAQDLLQQVRSGTDPVREKRRQKTRREREAKNAVTFREACEEWLKSRVDSGYYSDTEYSVYRIRMILRNHIYPAFADKPMSELTAADLFDFLKPFYRQNRGTWSKVRAVLNGVCRWSVAMGEAPQNPKIEALLRTSEGSLVNLIVVDADGLVTVTLTADVSETLPMGTTYLIVRLTADDFYRRTMVLETFRVLKKVADADFDHRTEAERCLAQAEKALMDYTSNGRSRYRSYTIGSRTLSFNSAQELMDLVAYWRNQVYLEKCAASGADPRKMLVEFV